VYDYRRVPGLEHAEILLPETAARFGTDWARDRAALWNRAESSEPRANARVAREYTVALPHELPSEARHALAKEFAQRIADRYGTAVDLAVHGPTARGDTRNYHAHILATTRELTADGLGAKATIELNTDRRRARDLQHVAYEFRELRRNWAELANDRLREAQLDVRLEPRSRATLAREQILLRQATAEHESAPPPVVAVAPGEGATAAVDAPLSPDAVQNRAAQQWLAYRAARTAEPRANQERDRSRDRGVDAGLEL
jgi:ATP-dependent exoDNAse (exonuclease V) alpha subunit